MDTPPRRDGSEVADDPSLADGFLHAAEPALDTMEEQARALLHDLRESFVPSYLTLISIIEGVLLGLVFELVAEGRTPFAWHDPSWLLVVNNVVIIALVWNEYRMGSFMYRWVPSLIDAVIPFAVGGLQATLILAVGSPMAWLGWLAVFYLAALAAFENMYRRAAEEARNEFVMMRNRTFRRLNVVACFGMAAALGGLLAFYRVTDTIPGWTGIAFVTALNIAFLVRGEVNWRIILGAARRVAG